MGKVTLDQSHDTPELTAIEEPAAGDTLEIATSAETAYDIQVDPNGADIGLEDGNLAFRFDDHSQVIFPDQTDPAQHGEAPVQSAAGEDLRDLIEGADLLSGGAGESLDGQAGIPVDRPAPGQTREIQGESGVRYVIDFDPAEARIIREDGNLVMVFEDGARIVFIDLVALGGGGTFFVFAGGQIPAGLVVRQELPAEQLEAAPTLAALLAGADPIEVAGGPPGPPSSGQNPTVPTGIQPLSTDGPDGPGGVDPGDDPGSTDDGDMAATPNEVIGPADDSELAALELLDSDTPPANDPPVNDVPGDQTTNEDTALVFSAANANAITVDDVDAGSADVEVTLSVSNGSLTLATTAGLTSVMLQRRYRGLR